MIVCRSCGSKKPYDKFRVRKDSKIGFDTKCKDCHKFHNNQRKRKTKDEANLHVATEVLSGREYTCKSCGCTSLADMFYYKRDRDYVYVNTTACKQCTKDRQRLRSFGITPDEYTSMLTSQGDACLICGISHEDYKATSQNGKVFAIDHCHGTGKIRGLLCDKCNRGLGYFGDSPTLLQKAISYLKGNDMV